ncbi:hypothetical protein KW791_01110 [Candidatus Parcubacteria bacterium]|nr:hypothetical protein [Candidatus Parcubacteria bacterium]
MRIGGRFVCSNRFLNLIKCILAVLSYSLFKKAEDSIHLVNIHGLFSIFARDSVIVRVSLNQMALNEYLKDISLKPIPIKIGDLWTLKVPRLVSKDQKIYVAGIHYQNPEEIILSPLNIWIRTNKSETRSQDFFRNICWVLAHELRHHHQSEKKLFCYRWYHTSIRARVLQKIMWKGLKFWLKWGSSFALLFCLFLPSWKYHIFSFWISALASLAALYFWPLAAAIVCEYQADQFAFKESDNPLLKKCINVSYHRSHYTPR